MFHLLPGRKILTTFAIINIALLFFLVYLLTPYNFSLEVIRYVSFSITILDVIAFLISVYFWRLLWKLIPILSEIYFPDINGIWEGKLIFDTGLEEEQLKAKVRIKQNLFNININLCSTTSKSYTLVAYPTLEAGNHKLYYVYHNTPKKPEYPEYKGTAILSVKLEAKPMELSGQYYTIRGTKGRIELERISLNSKEDYEFY
ncbi:MULTISPECIES: hypothetical protein [Cyanophyceae]|uniref:Cap15 family cyclic dinucleotide receptor domain-containing protein n=1 Tax=Cyanophyceae TaxID=3028117 RepID=UPI0016865FEE|nr:hypothetical protein [Trichocoleus sp. FACHB-40]MBD2005374.1 hypothetical protein [Trichocoleus sp. FACHB-40]